MTPEIDHDHDKLAYCWGCKTVHPLDSKHRCAGEGWVNPPAGSVHEGGPEDAPEAGIGQEDDQREHRGTDPVGTAEGSGSGDSDGQGEGEQEEAEQIEAQVAALEWALSVPRNVALGVWRRMASADTFEGVFRTIFDEAFDILVERQRKYGPENVKRLGLYGVFTRLAYDKVERLRRSMNGVLTNGEIELDLAEDFGDESLDDTLIDIANYALIMLALRRGVWGRPLA